MPGFELDMQVEPVFRGVDLFAALHQSSEHFGRARSGSFCSMSICELVSKRSPKRRGQESKPNVDIRPVVAPNQVIGVDVRGLVFLYKPGLIFVIN
jgi:hypothetical protein